MIFCHRQSLAEARPTCWTPWIGFVNSLATFGSILVRGLPVFAILLILGACGDPLAGVDRLTEVDLAEDSATASALPDAQEVAREGFLGTKAAQGDLPVGAPEISGTDSAAPTGAAGGFLRGLVRRAANADPAAAIAADVANSQSQAVVIETTPTTSAVAAQRASDAAEAVELAGLPARDAGPATAAAPRKRGLFGSAGAKSQKDTSRTGPDARDVPFGTVLAFGEIARVCEARGKTLGTKVGSLGRRGFTLYDSNAGIRNKRTFYLTGFEDKCPRQFTAANALFGAPSFYEQIRFSSAGENLPYADTDKAYDKLKSKVCRVGKKKPCGSKINKLDNEATFVSAYEFGEHNGRWKEFLVHDGAVLASALKSSN